MDIRDFFQLQRTFQGYGIRISASQIDKVMRIREDLGKLCNAAIQFQHFFHLIRNAVQLLHDGKELPLIYRILLLGKRQRQHGEHCHLSRKRFGGSHSDFGTYVDIRTRMRSPRNRRTNRITDAIDKCPTAPRQFHSCQCIRRLATLRNRNHHILTVYHRITVTEFRSILHFHRNAAKTFYQMFSDKRRMPGSTARHDDETFGYQQAVFVINHCGKHHICTFYIDTSAHTVMNAIGLLKNLFQHEVRITTLFQLPQIQRHRLHFVRTFHIFQVHHLQFLSAVDDGDLFIFQIYDFICIFHNRRSIRSQEKLIFTDTYHQRTTLAGCYNLIRIVLIQHGNGISADYFTQR